MADTKVTALPAHNTPTADDLILTVDDPLGVPVSKKMKVSDLTAYLGTLYVLKAGDTMTGALTTTDLVSTGIIYASNGNARLTAPSDAVLLLRGSGPSFSMLLFGGTTNAFPALRFKAGGIDFKLADNTDFADVGGRNVVATAQISAGTDLLALSTLQLGGTTLIASAPADGVLKFTNAAGTDFLKIQFGGTTAAFPSIQRSGTSLFFRLADASAFAPIQCGVINSGQIIASANIQTSGQVIATGDVTGDNHHVGSVSVMLDLTNAGMPNGAAASAGTLTNAPIAGNPTKWIPILVSGATKYIPAW